MKLLQIILVVVLFLMPQFLFSQSNNSVNTKRVALVFGNSNYEGHSSLGGNPINDAKDIASTLEGVGFDVLLKIDADQQTMITAIRDFGKINKDADVALFFFAGHGMQIDKVNYLLPIGVNIENKDDINFECVSVSTVQRIMETSNDARLNLIVLDACRNNPYRSWERGGDTGLADMTPPSGTLIAFSTSPGSVASNGSGVNGLYTEELIRQINIPQRIEDVFINTRVEVEKKSGGQQSPWELARLRGKFYLVAPEVPLVAETPIERQKLNVSFSTEPYGAQVIINDQEMGVTPCKVALDAGKYNVKYQKENYFAKEQIVDVSSETKDHSETLAPMKLMVEIKSNPKKANVWIDGKDYGKANSNYTFDACIYEVKASRKGFVTYQNDIDFSKKQKIILNMTPVEYRSKVKAMLYSAVLPGMGQRYLNRGGYSWVNSVVFYGLTFSSIANNNKAVTAYENYRSSSDDVSLRNNYITEAENSYKNSRTLMSLAATVWIANIIWTAIIPPDDKRFQNTQPTVGYNTQTGTLNYGLAVSFGK